MSQLYTIRGREGRFKIVNRGTKNHRVEDISNQENFLVETHLLKPLVNEGAPSTSREKFTALEKLVRVVAARHSNGLFLCGPGGTGKTYTVMKVIRELGLQEGTHFAICKGYTTPAGLFQFLKANSDKLVIFDDCDSVFKDPVGLNILKAVLDTYPTRAVSWNTANPDMQPFVFTGQIIFISNMDIESQQSAHLRAVITRVLTLTLGSTREDVLMRLQDLIPEICGAHSPETQNEIREFILENANHWPSPSLRILVHLNGLVKWSKENNTSWEDLALSLDV
jgi:hypothetical protein